MNVNCDKKKNKITKCNHKPDAKSSSLEFIELANMVYPPRYYAICPICGETFIFKKDEKGNLVELKNDEE